MTPEERFRQIRGAATSEKDAICMILSACADMGNENGLLLSGAKFEEAAEMIISFFGFPLDMIRAEREMASIRRQIISNMAALTGVPQGLINPPKKEGE